MSSTYFRRLRIDDWRQFSFVDICFDEQVTILTGTNGCGKTTLLNVLGTHFGWNVNLVATPYVGKRTQLRLWSDVSKKRQSELEFGSFSTARKVGTLEYSDGSTCELSTPSINSANYTLSFSNRASVSGLTIPSHRPAAVYHKIADVPLEPKTSAQHYQEFQQLLLQTYNSSSRVNPGSVLKRSLIALALLGPGNGIVQPNQEYQDLFSRFQSILSMVLPPEIGFQRLEVHPPEVLLITESGRFTFDAMSGGVNSIVGMAWQVLMHSSDAPASTIIIDEPENHLHPSMQRALLRSFAKAFPACRFIVATHSPFIVTSMESARVYGFASGLGEGIRSETIDVRNLSGTPNRILRDILMMPSLTPIWAEERIAAAMKSVDSDDPREIAKRVYETMRELGMAERLKDFSDLDGEVEE